jgi:DNA-directed RNA polymerase specialized sigma24 family protein
MRTPPSSATIHPMPSAPLEVDTDLLAGARKHRRGDAERLLEIYYPAVHRMAHGLCGREDAARRILRFVMMRSLTAMRHWQQGGTPHRWFHHHTVLASRRECRGDPEPQKDVLVAHVEGADPAYVAFVRALRSLPFQQREGYLLHHGEELDLRHVGIAMDCSREAARLHLEAATQTLTAVSGGQYEAHRARLAQAYQQLTPPPRVIVPAVKQHVSRHLLPRRIWRWLVWLVMLALLAGAGWLVWRFMLS